MRGGGREEESLVTGKEPSARRLAAPIGNASHRASVDSHDVLLITCAPIAGALKRQPLSIVTEVRLGVFSTEGYLLQRIEMRFVFEWSY